MAIGSIIRNKTFGLLSSQWNFRARIYLCPQDLCTVVFLHQACMLSDIRVYRKKYYKIVFNLEKKTIRVLLLISPWSFHWFFFIRFLPWCQKFDVFLLVFSFPGDDFDTDMWFDSISWILPGLLFGAVFLNPHRYASEDNCFILTCQEGENQSPFPTGAKNFPVP